MEESFSQWRDSPCVIKDKERSFVISDSDEDENKNIEKEQIFVIESSDSSTNVSSNLTPRKSSSEKLSLTEETIKKELGSIFFTLIMKMLMKIMMKIILYQPVIPKRIILMTICQMMNK
uniref:Uncharacterized protein n=1 Tax=Apis cerana TaxID=7461 RepID=V9IES9_APICE